MSKSGSWKRVQASHGTQTVVATVSANASNVEIVPVSGMQPVEVEERADGSIRYGINLWPHMEDVREYGTMFAAPLPPDLAMFVGQIIVQYAVVEQRINALLTQLCAHNQSTLDWKLMSKHGVKITRLQHEAGLIAKEAPVGSKLLKSAAENCRKLHRSRGNLAHGEIALVTGEGEIHIVATGKHGPEWFSGAELRDLALRVCKALYELTASLDPEDHEIRRAPREARFLRDFQANNPRPDPTPAKRPRQLRSSKQSARP